MKQIIVPGRMKKHESITVWMVTVSLLVLGAICVYIIMYPARSAAIKTMSAAPSVSGGNLASNSRLSYPVFHRQKIDALLKNYAARQSDEFATKTNHKKQDPDTRLLLNYTVLHYGLRFATVVFTQQEHIGAAPVVTSHKILTIDLQKQTLLTLTDIFKPGPAARQLIATILRDYFKQHAAAGLTAAQFARLYQLQLKDIQDFALETDTLVLFINPRQIDAKTGVQTIAIKRDLLSSVLHPEYSNADPSTNEAIDDPTDYLVEEMPKHSKEIDPGQKMLALTFDDGPGAHTERLLDVLWQYDAQATFFVIGRQVPANAAIVGRASAEGNEIGNHTWNHVNITTLSTDQMQQQINDTQHAVQNATGGVTPRLVRPPYGITSGAVNAYLQQRQLEPALWNVDPQDWLYQDSQTVYARIMAEARDGAVIILHDIHPTSVDAVTRAIPELVAQGYQLVTMSQLEQYR